MRFNIKVTERTEITANPNEISMGTRVIATVGEPKLLGTNTLQDAIIQQFGKKGYRKRKYGM